MRARTLILVLIAAATLAATAGSTPRPSAYVLPGAAVFPEGIAYQQGTDMFYVGSTNGGTIFRGHLDEPVAEVFLPGGSDGRTTAIGMKVDDDGRLFVAGGATGFVWVYDTTTGALIRRFTTGFSGQQFLNDLVIAPNGDAFVTDSRRPVLYRIPANEVFTSTTTETMEVWLDFTPLQYEPGFNVNGIVATPNGAYLVVAQSNTGELFRIAVATKTVTQIDLGGEEVSADGLWLRGRTLYAVARPNIARIRLDGQLLSGEVVSRTTDASFGFPTTIAIARGRMLVVNSQFDRQGGTPELPFTVSSIKVP